jgi:hypothetical protein
MLDILKKFNAVEQKTKITECGSMPSSAPSTPVSVNLSAPTAQDMAQMLRALANIESGEKPAMAAMPMAMAADAMEAEYETDEAFVNEPDEEYADHKFMTKDLSGGINRQKNMYPPAAKGDNPMAVEASGLSPVYIQYLKQQFGDKKELDRSDKYKVADIIKKSSIENLKQLALADIPHVSNAARYYIKHNTPGGMVRPIESNNSMAVESIKDRLYRALNEKKAKPDFLDMDKDGNKKEPMKKAVADKKVKEGAKPDFLDMDKDGNKKEPMKKAVADKKKNPFGNKK